jgi:hypothetical protein
MKTNPDMTGRFPALDALCDEFLRAARAESRQRRRLRLQRVALALAVAVIVVPVGYALAQDSGSDGGATGTASTGAPESSAVPFSPPSADPCDLPPGVVARPELAELCSPEASHNDLNSISSAPPPEQLIQACRADPKAHDCGVVLAMVDGKLAPGSYTDEELQAAVRAAGYDWSP